jgi:hypothetical protein
MKRIEVFLSQALEEDFRQHWEDACIKMGIKCKYSKIDNVTGQGESDPRLGNSVWPQFNTEYIVFCEENALDEIRKILDFLHKEYPNEDAAAFVSDAQEL